MRQCAKQIVVMCQTKIFLWPCTNNEVMCKENCGHVQKNLWACAEEFVCGRVQKCVRVQKNEAMCKTNCGHVQKNLFVAVYKQCGHVQKMWP